jgi:carbonic anhydrase
MAKPPSKHMAHHCKSLLIRCIDFRLAKGIKNYLEENNLLGDCDVLSIAGAIKSLSSPKDPYEKEFIMGQIGISVGLHTVQEVILVNHTDCGAYGGSSKFASPEDEKQFHIEEMKTAKEIILQRYSTLKIKMVLAKILSEGNVELQEIK